jgi:hypothetical protein
MFQNRLFCTRQPGTSKSSGEAQIGGYYGCGAVSVSREGEGTAAVRPSLAGFKSWSEAGERRIIEIRMMRRWSQARIADLLELGLLHRAPDADPLRPAHLATSTWHWPADTPLLRDRGNPSGVPPRGTGPGPVNPMVCRYAVTMRRAAGTGDWRRRGTLDIAEGAALAAEQVVGGDGLFPAAVGWREVTRRERAINARAGQHSGWSSPWGGAGEVSRSFFWIRTCSPGGLTNTRRCCSQSSTTYAVPPSTDGRTSSTVKISPFSRTRRGHHAPLRRRQAALVPAELGELVQRADGPDEAAAIIAGHLGLVRL